MSQQIRSVESCLAVHAMKKNELLRIVFICISIHVLLVSSASAVGITVDAGLTPPEGRWILRTHIRYMQRINDPTPIDRKMSSSTFSIVMAYGIRSDLTLMVRQALIHQEMSISGSDDVKTGLGDLFIQAKYKAYRRNTPKYTFGIAPTIGLELKSGHDSFTSGSWDLRMGLYTSWRSGPWGSDFNIAYSWNGFADDDEYGVNPGDQLFLNLAFAHQLSISKKASPTLAPVLELSYRRIWPDQQDGQDLVKRGQNNPVNPVNPV